MKKLVLLFLVTSTFAQNSLIGKKFYFYGDSITAGDGLPINSETYPKIVTDYYNGILVNKAFSGTTMMKQSPVDALAKYNMQTLSEALPIYNPNTDGLLFIAFLTNDVGLYFPNYTLENYGKAIDVIIANAYKKGWSKDRIKFNSRYFITEKGVNYLGLGSVPKSADLIRYNAFADLLKSKLNGYGIQYFDHWDSLSIVENPESHLDEPQRHPDLFMHKIIADNILKDLYIENTLSTNDFKIDNTFSNIQYYNLLGQRISEPKGITIVKAEKNWKIYTKKIFK